MKYLIIKDKKQRSLIYKYFKLNLYLKYFKLNQYFKYSLRKIKNYKILFFPKDSYKNRLNNRCVLSGRPKSVYREFGLSRIKFRELITQGLLNGIKKSSW